MNTFVHYDIASQNVSYIENCLKNLQQFETYILYSFFCSECHDGFEIIWKNFVATRQATYEKVKARV